MADQTNKGKKNVPGAYYVDADCIGCGMCHEVAPDFFEVDEEEGVAYVAAQPKDDASRELCSEAMNSCPVESIGNDGE